MDTIFKAKSQPPNGSHLNLRTKKGYMGVRVQSSKYFICHCHKDNETVEATRLTQLNNNK